jgi:hypothetical protein
MAFWQILWVLAALVTGVLMFGAWSGPHRSVSNLSRWATRLGIRRLPRGFERRTTDRWVFRGGLVTLALLLAVAWLVPSARSPEPPIAPPVNSTVPVAPKPPDQTAQHPARHIDAELKNAILVHIPKTKQIRIAVLKDDAEADQFSWEVDAFLREEKYTVAPRLFFAVGPGGKTPVGTSLYPDEKDPNIIVIRIGLNDRS